MTPDLLIFYEAPPRLSGGSILAGKELKALAEVSGGNLDADLVCASARDEVPADPNLESLLPDTVMIHRIDPIPRGRKTLLQRIVGGQGGWQQAAISKAAALFPAEHKKPALIYSRSHPPASHLAALELLDGPLQGVPWVAQFTEPWSQNPYYKSHMTRAALGRYEIRIYESATRLVFPCEAMRDMMLANASEAVREKARVVSPVYDPSLYGKAGLPVGYPPARSGVSTITHVGLLSKLRSPAPLYEGLAKLNAQHPELSSKIAVNLVGRIEELDLELMSRAYRVTTPVRHMPSVPYFESLTAMQASDVLLIVEAPVSKSVFYSGKFMDYLGARKPILAITPKDSFTATLMDEWQQPWCDVTDPNAIAAVLKRIATHDAWAPPRQEILESYLPQKVGRQMAGLLADVRKDYSSDPISDSPE